MAQSHLFLPMKIQYQNDYCTVFESALYRTTSTIIQLEDAVLLVDPNWLVLEIEYIAAFLQNRLGDRKLYLLFTHSDYDHIIGWKAFGSGTAIASEAFVNNPEKESIIKQIREFDHNFYIRRSYETAYPEIDIVISGNPESIILGRDSLQFYQAPGHNRDGIFTVIPELRLWISGDYLSNIEIPMIDYNFNDYAHTLRTAEKIIQSGEVTLLIPGHGDIATDRQEMERRLQNDMQYLRMLCEGADQEKVKRFIHKNYTDNPAMMAIHADNMKKTADM